MAGIQVKNDAHEKAQDLQTNELIQDLMAFIRKSTRKDPEFKISSYNLKQRYGISIFDAHELLWSLHMKNRLTLVKRAFYSLPSRAGLHGKW